MPLSLYKFIHRTIRGQFATLTIQSGRATYHDRSQVAALHSSMLKLSSFLNNHARREDRVILPVLKSKAFPDIAAVESEHAASNEQLEQLVSFITALNHEASSPSPDKESLEERGYAFYLQFTAYTAAYFNHMLTEEFKIMPFLWKNLSPPEIGQMYGSMQSDISHEEMMETLSLMYPYLTFAEAVKLTGMLKGEKEFPAMLGEIQRSLEPAECTEVLKAAGVLVEEQKDKKKDMKSLLPFFSPTAAGAQPAIMEQPSAKRARMGSKEDS
jgi:hypothetical protein